MRKHTQVGRVDIVKIYNEKFMLVKNRAVRIYIPEGYNQHQDRPYKVIYMYDGQNLFDGFTSWYNKEWQLDEFMLNLEREGKMEPSIIVGVDCSKDRMSEYMPTFSKRAIPGVGYKGNISMDFLVKQVIPYVEANYNVGKTRDMRSIGGSSMGGLMALGTAIRYPEVFSNIYAFSIAFEIYCRGFDKNYHPCELKFPRDAYNFVVKAMSTPEMINKFKIAICSGGIGFEKEFTPYVRKLKKSLIAKGWDQNNILTMQKMSFDHEEKQWAYFFPYAYSYFNGETVDDFVEK